LRPGLRLALFVALLGQLGMVAHTLLVVHVTCALDGGLVHARWGGPPAPPAREPVVRADRAPGGDLDDHCLLDEDGEAACPSAPVIAASPLPASPSGFVRAERALVPARRAPLFRLAPKNSPPA
jgi:hypothetical protein